MRVTELTKFNTFKRYIEKNRGEVAKYQQQLSSGLRVTKASDDSAAFTTSRHLGNVLRQNTQFQENISNGLSKARAAEDSLNSMLDALTDFKQIAIHGASDSVNAEDRKKLADQVSGIKKELMDLGNTEFNRQHLFGGTNTGHAPFSLDTTATGGVADTSNNTTLKTKISDTSEIPVSVTGKELRNTGSGDLFQILTDVEDALRNDDTTGVRGQLDNVEAASDHVSGLASVLGNRVNRMGFTLEQLKGQAIDQKGEISTLVDTDFSKAILNVQKYQTTYQAALSVHAQVLGTSLLNYI